jgi:hypothetical protein
MKITKDNVRNNLERLNDICLDCVDYLDHKNNSIDCEKCGVNHLIQELIILNW